MSAPEPSDFGRALLTIARSAIATELGLAPPVAVRGGELDRCGASFVTLRQRGGELRGCIGTIRAVRPLAADVHENAIGAAFHDARFPPLAARELDATTIEVSVLSAAERLSAADEADLIARLRPGRDGLILEYGPHRATLLPQVWETIPDAREFMAALKTKAGLPGRFWSPEARVSRYTVAKWAEDEFHASEAQA